MFPLPGSRARAGLSTFLQINSSPQLMLSLSIFPSMIESLASLGALPRKAGATDLPRMRLCQILTEVLLHTVGSVGGSRRFERGWKGGPGGPPEKFRHLLTNNVHFKSIFSLLKEELQPRKSSNPERTSYFHFEYVCRRGSIDKVKFGCGI